jgi:hypothetical protein
LKQERVIRFRRHNTDVRGTFFVEFPKVEGEQGPTKREESCVCVCVRGGRGYSSRSKVTASTVERGDQLI